MLDHGGLNSFLYWFFPGKFMRLFQKTYIVFTLALAFIPMVRDMALSIFFNHTFPFSDPGSAVYALMEIGFMVLVGITVSIIDIRRKNELESREVLDRMVKEKTEEIKLTQKISIEAIATLAEYRDQETGRHLQRIQEYVNTMAKDLMFYSSYRYYLAPKPDYIEETTMASILHDIGKIAIPYSILMKPGKLTDEEFETIKRHTVYGAEILEKADKEFREKTGKKSYLALARDIALFHHERWDGSGYPTGRRGEDIPLSARIIALCDVYDAVTSDRVYKKAWTHQQATEMILDNRGSHFDPEIIDSFKRIEDNFNTIRARGRS
ncbi:MAG: HD domain-containing phosphohydrolase [Pseudomonadota bacterium]